MIAAVDPIPAATAAVDPATVGHDQIAVEASVLRDTDGPDLSSAPGHGFSVAVIAPRSDVAVADAVRGSCC